MQFCFAVALHKHLIIRGTSAMLFFLLLKQKKVRVRNLYLKHFDYFRIHLKFLKSDMLSTIHLSPFYPEKKIINVKKSIQYPCYLSNLFITISQGKTQVKYLLLQFLNPQITLLTNSQPPTDNLDQPFTL